MGVGGGVVTGVGMVVYRGEGAVGMSVRGLWGLCVIVYLFVVTVLLVIDRICECVGGWGS